MKAMNILFFEKDMENTGQPDSLIQEIAPASRMIQLDNFIK